MITLQHDKPGSDWRLGFLRGGQVFQIENLSICQPIVLQLWLKLQLIHKWATKVSATITDAGLEEMIDNDLANRMWNGDETGMRIKLEVVQEESM